MKRRTLRLFFVSEHHHGHDYDLFVWAPDADIAIRIWNDTFELAGDLPDQVFLVPLARPREAGTLPWHRPRGVVAVWRWS
jgi:diadenosine tetraphosphatase ApaH/serine/threonine PP2A family protein phosphatase